MVYLSCWKETKEVALEMINEMQRIALEESRLGIPLLVGRYIIHGYRTIFPVNI